MSLRRLEYVKNEGDAARMRNESTAKKSLKSGVEKMKGRNVKRLWKLKCLKPLKFPSIYFNFK